MTFPQTHVDGEIVDAAWVNDLESRVNAAIQAVGGLLKTSLGTTSGSIALDCQGYANAFFAVTVNAKPTFSVTNAQVGARITVAVSQTSSGGVGSFGAPVGSTFPRSASPLLNPEPSATDVLRFFVTAVDGSNNATALLGEYVGSETTRNPILYPSADTTGTTDSAAVNAMLVWGDVYLAEGTYYLNVITYTAVSSSAANSRRVVALGPVTIVQKQVGGVFVFKGGWDNLGTVTNIATSDVMLDPSSTTTTSVSVLTLSGSQTVAQRDVLKVVSDDFYPWINNRPGEISLAGLSSGGSVLTLSNALIDAAFYVTNVRVGRLWPISFRVEGPITFDTDSGIQSGGGEGWAITLNAARDCYVGHGVQFQNNDGPAIYNASYQTTVEGVRFRNVQNLPSTLGRFGYGLQDLGWETKMRGCHGEYVRHLYSEGGNFASANDPNFERYGGGWFALVSDCTAMNASSQAYDTHETSYGVHFDSCVAYGNWVGQSSGGWGLVTRGRKNSASNCKIVGCANGMNVNHGTNLSNCVVRDNPGIPLQVSPDATPTPSNVEPVIIDGGLIEGLSVNVLCSLGTTTTFTGRTDVRIKGTTFRAIGAPAFPRAIELLGPTTLHYKNIVWDIAGVTGTPGFGFFGALSVTKDSQIIYGDGCLVVAGSAAAGTASNVALVSTGAGNGSAAVLELGKLRWEHDSIAPAFYVRNTTTGCRYSGEIRLGTGSWSKSCDVGLDVTSGTATLPVAVLLDDHVTVTLTGAPSGGVSIAAIPTTPTVPPGQKITVFNNAGQSATISGFAAIPAAGVATYSFMNATWRKIA